MPENFLEMLLATDEEERRELSECGVKVRPHSGEIYLDDDAAQTDAVVSQLQRRLLELGADAQRYKEARLIEHQLIDHRYNTALVPLDAQMKRTEAIVLDIASRADFGKKKSRATPYGSYGVRSEPARLEIEDAKALLAWVKADGIRTARLLSVRTKVEESVAHKALVEFVAAREPDADGVLDPIPGVVERSAEIKPFVKLSALE